MKNIFIIPARSGSKGIKNKNLKLINGIPLFVWSIIHAKYIAKKDDLILFHLIVRSILILPKAGELFQLKGL